jgi:hypothetical protein
MGLTLKRTHLTRRERKQLDTLLALPLARFRAVIAHLTPDELTTLAERIETLEVKQRWTLGSHGIDRHRAPIELGLLARRGAEVRRRIARGPAPVQLHLVAEDGAPHALVTATWEEQAA